jgi:hypothetical protein
MTREVMSVAPPGAKGTMKRIGREGNDCGVASAGASAIMTPVNSLADRIEDFVLNACFIRSPCSRAP